MGAIPGQGGTSYGRGTSCPADRAVRPSGAWVARGLSVGVSVRRLIRGESATGLIIGAVMAPAFPPFACCTAMARWR
ncbi:hypothetical protein [Planomonospora parontospora]|uniref:hypothetical protein n=1 Tax=Planomonospora parontospora TaxID=58119 RepID=UPI0016705C98|nr:hypothetical protein [Planomonospora parontospora]